VLEVQGEHLAVGPGNRGRTLLLGTPVSANRLGRTQLLAAHTKINTALRPATSSLLVSSSTWRPTEPRSAALRGKQSRTLGPDLRIKINFSSKASDYAHVKTRGCQCLRHRNVGGIGQMHCPPSSRWQV
jgi:hypothetical protein